MTEREKAIHDNAIEFARGMNHFQDREQAYRDGFAAGLRQRRPGVGQKLRLMVRGKCYVINSRGRMVPANLP